MSFSAAALAIVFAVSLMTSAQGAVPGDNTRRPGDQGKGVNLSGQVSKDGKAFVADDDNTWAVNNSGLLNGFEGRYLTVKSRMDPTKRAIRVLYVVESEIKHATNFRDSAFRR